MKCSGRTLLRNSDGAVAPTIALSLVGLIAIGGVAFDYARLASMDTELQTAADQAALAAASQLDGSTGACARAANAARSLVINETRMANDGNSSGRQVTIPLEATCDALGQVRFYQNIDKTTAATTDANAKFVEITVDTRTARYALTPIAAAFSSGAIAATAFAGLNSAICKVPPLMLCNPNEDADEDFTIADYVGKGIRLVANDGGGDYAPGNFGFLDAGLDTSGGANALRIILGRTALAANCVSGDGVTTDPGNMVSVRDALNTRFDIYDSGLNTACGNNAAQNAALCPPAINARKDLLQDGNAGQCGLVANGAAKGWKEAVNPYPGSQNPGGCDQNSTCFGTTGAHELGDTELTGLSPTGYPRDFCHAFSVTGSCTDGRIGDGNWDRFAYFKSHQASDYTEMAPAAMNKANTTAFDNLLNGWFGKTNPTRYEVYKWEMQTAANRAARLHTLVSSGGLNASSQPVCAPPGIVPSTSLVDRRVLTVAVVNCDAEDVHGKTTSVTVTKWIDVFLTEPSIARNVGGARTENSDVYIEVIGQTQNATDEGAVQLVKKSVPYLIE